MADTIRVILANIRDNELDSLKSNLSLLPLESISHDKSDTLIAWFLNEAYKTSNKESVKAILYEFDLKRIHIEPLPAISNMFLNPNISHDVLKFVTSCVPEKQPIDYFCDLVNMRDDTSAIKVGAKLLTIFRDLSNDEWKLLHIMTQDTEDEEYPNQMLKQFFETKALETGAPISKPVWVRNYDKIDLVPIPNIPNVKEAVELLIQDFKKHKIGLIDSENSHTTVDNNNQVQETLISQYCISSISEKIQMLSSIIKIDSFDDTGYFREYGPVNTQYTFHQDLLDNTECSKYGGCRMFLCKEFEIMRTDGEEIDILAVEEQCNIADWFRGSCDKCLKTIPKRCYCVRQPLKHGGWRGCYCSFECMEQDANNDPQVLLMIGRIKEQLNIIGIRDR